MESLMGCLVAIVLLMLNPVLGYLEGYVTGLILNLFVGDGVVSGLNALFNTTRFTTDMLPVICGALGVIGSFFKSSVDINKKG